MDRLKDLWKLSRSLPPAVAIERITASNGLIPYIASDELGEGRAGAIYRLIELARGMRPVGFAATLARWLQRRGDRPATRVEHL